MDLSKLAAALEATAPTVLGLINPSLIPLAGVITRGIQEAAAIKGSTGADKLQHVVNIVVDSAEGADVFKPGVIDPSVAAAAAADAINAVYNVVKAVHNQPATPSSTGAAGAPQTGGVQTT